MSASPVESYLACLSRPAASRAQAALSRVAALLTGGSASMATVPWQMIGADSAAIIRLWLTYCYPSTAANQILTALRGTMRWSIRIGQAADEDGAAAISALGRARRGGTLRIAVGRPLAKRNVQALLDSCAADDSPRGIRDAALIALMGGSGLSAAEAARVRWQDFDRDRGILLVRTAAGRPGRALLISSTSAEYALLEWADQSAVADGPIFCRFPDGGPLSSAAVSSIVRRRARSAGISGIAASDLGKAYRWELGRLCGREPGRPVCALLSLEDGGVWLLTPPFPLESELVLRRGVG